MGYVTKFLSTPSARRATQSGKTCTCVPSNFYPRPPRGGRHAHISIPAPFAQFLSTPSARRATYKRTELEPSMDISIHALREEGDSRRKRSKSNLKYFYPRPPRGGRPRRATDAKHRGSDFYPRPPRGGRRVFLDEDQSDILISIHALREEGDAGWRYGCSPADISIHALREEGDICRFGASSERPISIHALREEGDHGDATAARHLDISIHALREEGDLIGKPYIVQHIIFLSTPSARRATGESAAVGIPGRFLSTPSARRATAI